MAMAKTMYFIEAQSDHRQNWKANVTVARVRTEKKMSLHKTHGSKMIQNSANRKLNVRPIKKDVDSNLTRPKRSEEAQ